MRYFDPTLDYVCAVLKNICEDQHLKRIGFKLTPMVVD